MKRLFPTPLLSAALFVLWLLLNLSVSPGNLLLAAVLAVLAPLLMAPLRPQHAHVRKPMTIARLIGRVGSVLLLHVFDQDDEQRFIEHFKATYERPLMEIFE